MKKLADNISNYISRELGYEQNKTEIISYGLQIFLGTLTHIVSILALAYLLNIFKPTLAVVVSYIIFRRLIGGSHYDTQAKCYFMGIILILSLGKLGGMISLTTMDFLVVTVLLYILAVKATILWIPAGTAKKMIKDINTRKKIKIEVIVTLTIWIIICNYLSCLSMLKYGVSSSLGVFLAFFLVTPLGYKFTNLKLFKS